MPTTTTPTTGTTDTTDKPTATQPAAPKAAASQPATKTTKPTTTKAKAAKAPTAKAKPPTAKRTGTEPGYLHILKFVPATEAGALNNNKIAKAADKWGIPTKNWLIKGVERGDIARIEDKAHPGRFLYHLTAKGKKASKAGA
jgi:hypothetical protein